MNIAILADLHGRIHINKLAFDRVTGSLRRHVMGVTKIDSFQELSFHFVAEDRLPRTDSGGTS
jgi:hypothetical protein